MNKNTASATVKTPAANFTGDVWMDPVFNRDGTSQLTVGLVRFTTEVTIWLGPVTDRQYLVAHIAPQV